MKLSKLAGVTSEIWQVFIRDSSSTIGAGLTGLAFNSASLTAYYHRDTDTTATAITLVTMTVGTFTSSGFKEIDATNMPGWYQFCPPNAALASGAKSCGFHLKGATNMAPLPIEVQLTAVNPDSATAYMTSVATVTTVTNQLTAAQIATGVWQDTTAGDFTTALSVGKSLMNGVALGTGLIVAAVSGAVGSVTGAVGSVTAIVNADIVKINTDATAAANIAKTTRAIGRGTATTAGSSTTLIATSAFAPVGVAANADQFAGRVLTFDADTTSTKLRGQSTSITSSTAAAAPVFTVAAITIAPVDGDTFSVT